MCVYGLENDLVHRYFAPFFPDHPEQHLERLRGFLRTDQEKADRLGTRGKRRVVAVGEMGLDFVQSKYFVQTKY